MRLTLIALICLPMTGLAQSAPEPKTTQNAPVCAVGTIWDGATQSCVTTEDDTSPLQGLPERSGCHEPPAVSA